MADDRREWHLDKGVSVGHILTTAMVALALAAGWVNVNKTITESQVRVGILQEDVRDLKAAYVTQNELHRLEFRQMRTDFNSMRSELMAELRAMREEMHADQKADK